MPRYIDADALKEKLNSFIIVGGRGYGKTEGQHYFNKILSAIIDDEPTIDYAPVKHGRWVCVEAEPEKVWCDNCKTIYRSSDLLNIGADDEKVNFCPNCGAIMDGGDTT